MPLKATNAEAKRLQAEANKRLVQHTIEGEVESAEEKKKRKDIERQLQTALFWQRDCIMRADPHRWPDLAFLFATLNGVFIPPALKKQVKDSGLTPGVLDVQLPCSRDGEDGHFCGLAIDMKTPGEYPTAEQKVWAAHLVKNGWRVYFCESAVEAWHCICSYLGVSGADHWAVELQGQERMILLAAARM